MFAYVVCRGAAADRRYGGAGQGAARLGRPRSWARSREPDDIRFADNLPKTRSGKIMRRLLRAIARGEEISQDVSTLENPAILDQLRGVDAGESSGQTTPSNAVHTASRSAPPRTGRRCDAQTSRGQGRRAKTRAAKLSGAKSRRRPSKTRRAKSRVAKTRRAKTNRSRVRGCGREDAAGSAKTGGLRRASARTRAAKKRR